MASLIRRQGGEPTIAPSMREAPLEKHEPVFEFWKRLTAGEIDLVILMTGVGTQAMFDVLTTRMSREDVVAEMNRHPVCIRGPKPAVVLRNWTVRIDHRAPEPNTWREVLTILDANAVPLSGTTVAVQEYGKPSIELYDELRRRGATVVTVPVYRWELPADLEPLKDAIRRCVAGEFDALLFTSAQQAHHVLQVADQIGLREQWLAAANRCVIGSIGPTATETLVELNLKPDLEPDHPKMGPLVSETMSKAPSLLSAKQSQ
ncbi:bifunctional uroporphyrinogen-III synthetase/response regulator domain protein [Caulifigura coniformis]|uniref:Bifunctional uroporphyrinogen-III synthetase/response regulator domain protein n=2 Tax=Caulifigura coniformis TaxID=2527983 RepID=A0A517SKL1_9PLAN|nr:bifunctional uroporphyrinogen-III synthetase/response regulator domain protein [Caulifigura coniformis]